MESRYGIRELVQASGVPRRTVRYYVQRGLIPAPEGAGRGHYYTADHLERLLRVRDLQGQGLTLDEIAVRLDADVPDVFAAPLPDEPERPSARPTFHRHEGGDDAEIALGQEASAPRTEDLEIVTRIRLVEGVELHVAPPARVPSPARIAAMAAAVRRILEN